MKKALLFISLFLLFNFFIVYNCNADSASIGGHGNTVKILDDNKIRMKNEEINMYVNSESTEVDVVYNFVNSTSKSVEVIMGFPEKVYSYEDYKLNDFKAFEEGEEIGTEFRNEEDAVTEGVNWYIYKVNFGPYEEKQMRNTYSIKHTGWAGKFMTNYVLETGASWEGEIEIVDIYAYFEENVSLYDVLNIKPQNFYANEEENRIEWHLNNIEPKSEDNIEISMLNYYSPTKGSCVCREECLDYNQERAEEEIFGYSSSYLKEGETNYYACKAFDGDQKTAWVEGSEDGGVGEWISVPLERMSDISKFPDTCLDDMCSKKIKINKFNIFNGFGESKELWEKNNRVKEIKIIFNDSKEIILEIPDIYGYQTIDLPEEITTNRFLAKVEILDVYKGSEYNDTAITEIRFLSFIDNDYILSEGNIVPVENNDLYERLKGSIVLKVEENGEAYYINPKNENYYYLGRPDDAFRVMQERGLGISEKDFNSFNGCAPENLAGVILLRVEANGEAYYVNPEDRKIYYLGRPSDAFDIMRNLGKGISSDDFNRL
ncbi:hypothetical protein K8R62_03960 [bacterium]|nr:hypothetical protein [bacterium]